MASAKREFNVFKESDQFIIDALLSVASIPQLQSQKLEIGYTDRGGPRKTFATEEAKEKLSEFDLSQQLLGTIVFTASNLDAQKNNQHVSITLERLTGHDVVRVQTPDNNIFDFTLFGQVIQEVYKRFRLYERTDATDKLLGNELAEFYRKREQSLLRLEEIQQRLIENQEAYQRELQSETEEIRKQLREEGNRYKEELDAKSAKRTEEQNAREAELDERLKQIDDRDSKHARRHHQKEIKDALKLLDTNFKLSEGTGKKRNGMHLVFLLALAFSLAGVLYAVIVDSELEKMATWIKVGLSSLSFVGFAVAYLRWMNDWFMQHADEEFRLKRLSLDIDRASWLVETVSEWQAEHTDQPLPDELLKQLSEGLFAANSLANTDDEHALSTLLGASSHLRLKTPAATVDIDRKGLGKLKKQ